MLLDGWRIDLICRYRPLIYYAACGSAAFMQQFTLSLTSLVTIGAYDGAILVMTHVAPRCRECRQTAPQSTSHRLASNAGRDFKDFLRDEGGWSKLIKVNHLGATSMNQNSYGRKQSASTSINLTVECGSGVS